MLLEAIAEEEGFFEPHTRPRRNNNPGDLVYGPESVRFGASGSDGRFAIFPDSAVGFVALRRWLSIPARFTPVVTDARPVGPSGYLESGYLGATVAQVIFRFAPPVENDWQAYLANICKRAHLTPETILTEELLR